MSWLLPFVVRGLGDLAKELAGRGSTLGAEDDLAILADDDDGPLDPVTLWLQGVVCGGDFEAIVHEQIERQVELVNELLVTGGIAIVDPEWLGIEGAEVGQRLAHGGQLVRSAAG
jgi:hypothetical protein